ncbi:MAG TPA: AraC family transcriptional regulator [Streptosporangiaceae bacterium]|nr:AraC family transcriptional regulator [Streptosporangiaceae bacterium]
MEAAELAHLRRARDLLDREYARPLDVPAMARAALMSPSLFSRRFREAYGDTPYGYLQARGARPRWVAQPCTIGEAFLADRA